jgi:diaminopimelate decarboxylase
MNDLLRPSLYNAFHKVEFIDKNGETSKGDVVGPICESGDFLSKNVEIPKNIEHGDLVVVHSAGSYGFVMSSNYNSRGRVAEIAVQNGEDRVIRERESFEDLIEKEEKFLK